MDVKKLTRRLNRLKEQRDKLQWEHGGNELKYTYWGGYDLGYLKGKICEIEDILDELGVGPIDMEKFQDLEKKFS